MRVFAIVAIALTCLTACVFAQPPEEISPLAMPTPTLSFWFEDTERGRQWIEKYQVQHNGKPVTPPTVATWGGTISWVLPTPEAGDYFVSLQMVSGEERPGVVGYRSGDKEIRTEEFREPGGFTACQKTYRITAPEGQKETLMFLSGRGVYLGRVDMAPAPESMPYADGRIHELAASSYRTVLRSKGGDARAIVLLPPKDNAARPLADKLAKKLDLPTRDEPALGAPLPQYPLPGMSPDTNLILLSVARGGPLAIAMRRARFIETDHANPGPEGYLIRVIARPFRGQANVVFLGASDALGLAKAVDAFAPRQDTKSGETVYDTFLDAHYSEKWLKLRIDYKHDAPSEEYVAQWVKRLEKPYAGYTTAAPSRSYINRTASWGDRYYRSGSILSAETFKRFIFKMQDDRIYGGIAKHRDSHMALYHLMRAWDRVEEAPCFSEADRLRIVNFLLQCIEGDEGFQRSYTGYREYSGPVRMRHNHQTILGRGLMLAYLYYSRLYDLGRADMWKSWCDTLVENGTFWGHAPEDSANYEPGTFLEVRDLLHYQGLSTKGHPGTDSWPRTALRFAAIRDSFGLPAAYGDCWNEMDHGRLAFFEAMRDDWDWPGAQAMLDHAARGYKYAIDLNAERVPKDAPGNDLYAYLHGSVEVGGLLPAPDPQAVDQALRPVTGLAALPMGKGFYRYMTGEIGNQSFWDKHGRPDAPPYEKTADKIQYRDGWSVESEYLLVETLGWANHGHMDLGALVQYCHGGRLWIVDGGYNNTGAEHHSTLDLSRNGKPGWRQFEDAKGRWGDFRYGPQMFEIVEIDPEGPGIPGPFKIVLRARDYAGATWVRSVRGGAGAPLVVRDEVRAEKPGAYKATVRLRLLGDVSGQGGAWKATQKGPAELPLHLDIERGDRVAIGKWMPDGHTWQEGRYPYYAFLPPSDAALPSGDKKRGIPKTIEWTRERELKTGDKMVFEAAIGPSIMR